MKQARGSKSSHYRSCVVSCIDANSVYKGTVLHFNVVAAAVEHIAMSSDRLR